MKQKAVIVFSGGQDSTTCLFWALAKGLDPYLLTIDYGQRHSLEIQAAKKIAQIAGYEKQHEIVQVGDILQGTSPLVSDNPLEQYKDHESLPGGLEKTFVPMRNQLFLTIAANRAYNLGTSILVTGVSAEDFGGYPDCTPNFIDSMEDTCTRGTFTGKNGAPGKLTIYTPLIYRTKKETVEMAMELDRGGWPVYRALSFSHTAYDGNDVPNGKDHASLLRAKGFEEAGVPDPLVLRAVLAGKMPLPRKAHYKQGLEEYFQKVAP